LEEELDNLTYSQSQNQGLNTFGFLPPHHIRTNSAGHYYMVTSSSDNSQILCKDDLETDDLTSKVYNTQKHFYDPHKKQRSVQYNIASKRFSDVPASISNPVSAKANNRSPRLEFSTYQQPTYDENHRSISSKMLQNRLQKEKSFEASSILKDRKDAALAKFRSERRNRVRTAVAKELAEIKARLELLGAFDKANSDLNSTCTTTKSKMF